MNRLAPELIGLDNVSAHAVTRYVQRVLGVNVDDLDALTNYVVAVLHSDAAGMTVDQVKGLILIPPVRLGLQLGAVAVRTSRFVAALQPQQRLVLTVLPPRSERPYRRWRTGGAS